MEFDMLSYPMTVVPDTNGTLLVGFPDIPEANSVGANEGDALGNAADALETAIALYIEEGRTIPMPSTAAAKQITVALPAISSAKVLLWNELVARKLRKADLARLLGVDVSQIDMLFDLGHLSQIEFVEQAATALGKTLSVELT